MANQTRRNLDPRVRSFADSNCPLVGPPSTQGKFRPDERVKVIVSKSEGSDSALTEPLGVDTW